MNLDRKKYKREWIRKKRKIEQINSELQVLPDKKMKASSNSETKKEQKNENDNVADKKIESFSNIVKICGTSETKKN